MTTIHFYRPLNITYELNNHVVKAIRIIMLEKIKEKETYIFDKWQNKKDKDKQSLDN